MEKIILFMLILTLNISATNTELKKNCLSCHKTQQIPTKLIYKRYLLKYSTKKAMKKAILYYIKNPTKENSIMPKPFFFKFPMKFKNILSSKKLDKNINLFLDEFDVRHRLVLQE